jgi:phage shock protein C
LALVNSSQGDTTTLRPLPVLRRSRTSRVLAGVCGGIGHYFGVDPVVVRVAFILLVVAGFGLGILLYILLWLVIPEESFGDQVVHRSAEDRNGPRFLLGTALVIVGGILLISNLVPWLFDKGVLTALALVAVGSVLIIKAIRQ